MSGEWSDDMTAAYRRWIFTSPEGDIDPNDGDILAKTQEDAFGAGFLAADSRIQALRKRLQKPVHPYGDVRIPKVPEVQFAREAYGEQLFDDIAAILNGDGK